MFHNYSSPFSLPVFDLHQRTALFHLFSVVITNAAAITSDVKSHSSFNWSQVKPMPDSLSVWLINVLQGFDSSTHQLSVSKVT